jgi:hypothetical protein
MSDDLDALLAAPLPEATDDGFSRRVEERIAAEDLRAARLETYIVRGALGLALVAAPFTPQGAALGDMMEQLGGALLNSDAVAAGLAGLLLTFVALEFARD